MAQRPLFGGPQGSSSQSKYLVEFRAGKCTQKGKLVTPDKRKGLVYVQQTDDSLIHFCWKDRSTGQTEDDLIMFPGDADFEKVTQCTTGRVFVLKFKSNNKRCFYWMQEPKDDKDADFRTKVNKFLNDPSAHQRSSDSNFGGSVGELADDHDLNSIISGMSQRQLMELFGGLGGNPNISALLNATSRGQDRSRASRNTEEAMDTTAIDTTPAPAAAAASAAATTTASTPSTGKGTGIKPQNLAEILNKVNADAAAAAAAVAGASSPKVVDSISGAITSPEALEPLINNPDLMARVKEFLPPTDNSTIGTDLSGQLKMTVKSPQFQQAVAMFSAALSSGQMGPLMTQFGMGADVAAAAASGNMDEFVKALEKSKAKKKPDDAASTDVDMKE